MEHNRVLGVQATNQGAAGEDGKRGSVSILLQVFSVMGIY